MLRVALPPIFMTKEINRFVAPAKAFLPKEPENRQSAAAIAARSRRDAKPKFPAVEAARCLRG
jgi:hypothetical protein